jgi:DNA adenine methylase
MPRLFIIVEHAMFVLNCPKMNLISNVVYIRSRRRRIVFGWYGGKFSHLDWLLPLLPRCHHYCEPFSGSGAVLINRVFSPVETYNDIDGDVVTFFRVLRERHEELN